jgi:endonuclease/exonuclease/phosphatase family metal-dependent hydrolase
MKKLLLAFFTVFTFATALIYFASCLTPFISPVAFAPMAFLALGFPYLVLCMVVLVMLWVFITKKVALYLFLLIFAGSKNLYSTFAVNRVMSENFSANDTNSIRILTWNVRNFDNPAVYTDTPGSTRRRMFQYIQSMNADVLCLQEYSDISGTNFLSNSAELYQLGYTYHYTTKEIRRRFSWGIVNNGTAIYSKIRIAGSGKILLGDPSYPEYLAYVDVGWKGRQVRIFTAHFKSMNLFAFPHDPSVVVPFHYDSMFINKDSKLEKLRVFGQEHARQAFIVKKALKQSPYPIIFTGDMNSVPTSYAYNYVAKDLQDAFLVKGWGLGTTLVDLPKTLRIDYLLIDQRLLIKNYQKHELNLSDHFPQVVKVAWKQ